MTREVVLLAMGSNQSASDRAPRAVVQAALECLAQRLAEPLQVSGYYRTPAFPVGSGPDFVNVAMRLESSLSAQEVLAACHAVEADFGRVRLERWAPRVLDIDLLAHGSTILPDRVTLGHWMDLPPDAQKREAPAHLILPHPRLHERGFVLRPLADVAPDWVHPVLGQSVREMLAALPDAALAEIRAI